MEVDAERLIFLVEQRPQIYIYTLKEHHNKDYIERLWEEIANAIGDVTSAECKTKWNVLRSSYTRHVREAKKMRDLPSGSAAQKKKKWYFVDVMAFLGNFIGQHRQTKSNIMIQNDIGDGNESEVNEQGINESVEDNDVSSVSSPNNPSDSLPPIQFQADQSKKKQRKMTAAEMVAGPMVQFLQSRCQAQKTDPPNANKQFLESLLPDLYKLSSRRQREFKLKVLGLLNSFVDDQENEQLMMSSSNSITSPASSHSSYIPQGLNTNVQDAWDYIN